jgi:L-lactate dehydrogenase complex protein LldG
MISDSLEARDVILARLRRALAGPRSVFREPPEPAAKPAIPSAVTRADGDRRSLAKIFGEKLEAIDGSYEIVEDAADVRRRVLELLKEWPSQDRQTEEGPEARAVLSWAPRALPIEDLRPTLADAGIALVVPEDLHDDHTRAGAARLTVGLTGVDAAFASTGSMVLASSRGRSRAASLLPLRHLAIVPMSRIYENFEAWLAELRQEERLHSLLRVSGQIVFITGPSKSADIELNLTLGVHGPRFVHALIYDDAW